QSRSGRTWVASIYGLWDACGGSRAPPGSGMWAPLPQHEAGSLPIVQQSLLVRSPGRHHGARGTGIVADERGRPMTHESGHTFDKEYWERHWHKDQAEAPGSMGSNPPNPHLVRDRKSTRLNSSHVKISYAVF